MKTRKQNDRGVVFKKINGQYHVRTGQRTIRCVLSTRPHKQRESRKGTSELGRQVVKIVTKAKHSDPIAVGDEVKFKKITNDTGVILEVLPRRNKLSRQATTPGKHVFEQVIVTNVDQVVPVFSAANPTPKWGLLDRYLVSAELEDLPSLICITKIDLADHSDDYLEVIESYRGLGYQVELVSNVTGEGIAELKQALQGQTSALVGKSGVGKTSLLNALQPGLDLPTSEVSRGKKSNGKHTTTHLEMHRLENGGSIVDTPGIREFGLWDIYEDELASCFPEMQPLIGTCRFGLDCSHDEEPGCAIRRGVMDGTITPQRYKSYIRLRGEL